MRWIARLLASALLVVVLGTTLSSAPVDGVIAKQLEVPADGWSATLRFRGGERACVQLAPLKDTSAAVEITIHDANGKKIAEDKARPETPFFAAVFWYPPRDGDYKITISASHQDVFYLAIR